MTVRHIIPPAGAHEESEECGCWPTVLPELNGIVRVIHHEPGGKPAEVVRLADYQTNRTTEGGRHWLRTH